MTIRPLHVVQTPSDTSAPGWQSKALCVGRVDLFFAPKGERPGRRAKREATAASYCAQCPVSDECREAGRVNGENGIWGGETDEQRAVAGYPPRNIMRKGVALARRRGLDMEPGELPETVEFQIDSEPTTTYGVRLLEEHDTR